MSAQHEMLIGPKPGQMNLLSVKMRADELRKNLDQLIYDLQTNPAGLQWCVITT